MTIVEMSEELSELGLTAVPCEDLNLERFNALHRPVGPIQLYGLTDLVNQAMQLYGYEERVTPNKFRSVYNRDMLSVPLVNFCSEKKFQPNHKILTQAVESVKKKFITGKVQPISLEESFTRLMADKKDHMAGLPTLGKKQDDVTALARAKQVWRGKCPPPPVIGHRGKNTEVVRAVFMYPFEQHIVEGCFYYPLFDLVRRNPIYPVGPLYEKRYYMRKYSSNASFDTKFSIDYSSFDASISSHMIGIAFSILAEELIMDDKQRKNWERVQTFFSTSPFLAPDGMVYKGRRGGVPSGSMFTQLVDSLCNAVALEYALISEGIKHYRYLVYGDDSWVVCRAGDRGTPQELLTRIAGYVAKIGLKMNVTKTEYAAPDKAICFCGHYDIMRGRPVQDAIDKLCYPERQSKSYSTRVGICERVIAYMADAEAMYLNIVYLALAKKVPLKKVVDQPTNLFDVLYTKVAVDNRRHLPGILQISQVDLEATSSYMKIRAAL